MSQLKYTIDKRGFFFETEEYFGRILEPLKDDEWVWFAHHKVTGRAIHGEGKTAQEAQEQICATLAIKPQGE